MKMHAEEVFPSKSGICTRVGESLTICGRILDWRNVTSFDPMTRKWRKTVTCQQCRTATQRLASALAQQ